MTCSKRLDTIVLLSLAVISVLLFRATTTTITTIGGSEDCIGIESVGEEIMESSFTFVANRLSKGVLHYKISKGADGGWMKWREFVDQLRSNVKMQDQMTQVIADAPFKGLFFETLPVTLSSMEERIFQFVLVDSSQLAGLKRAEVDTFQDYFDGKSSPSNDFAVSFPNLGRDALLVVPKLPPPSIAPIHIKSFFDTAREDIERTRGIWQLCATSLQSTLKENPDTKFWFSTSGLGVYYLHFRIDKVPKYYTYGPFKQDNVQNAS